MPKFNDNDPDKTTFRISFGLWLVGAAICFIIQILVWVLEF